MRVETNSGTNSETKSGKVRCGFSRRLSNRRLAAVLFASASAGLGAIRAASADVYSFQGGGSITSPTSGNWSSPTSFFDVTTGANASPVSAAGTELDFNGSGSAYTSTNDLPAGSFNLTTLQFYGSSAVTIAPFNSSVNSLTFLSSPAGATPVINQNGAGNVIINTPLNFSSGVTIGGSGTGSLTFNGTFGAPATDPATFSGNINVNYTGGTVNLNGVVNTGPTAAMNIAAGVVVQSAGTLNLDVAGNGGAATSDVIGAGTLRLTSTTNGPTSPDIFFGPDHVGNDYYGARLTVATLDLGSSQRYIFANSGHNSVSNYNGNEDARISSSIIGSGGITYIAQDSYSGLYPPLSLAGSNTFTGKVEIDSGSIYLQNPNALVQGNQLVFNSINQARLFLYGNNATVSNLQSSGAGTALISNGNVQNHDPIGAATLTVNQTANTTFGGSLVDAQAEYDRTTGYPAQPLSLTLSPTSTGTLTLIGSSTYTGPTTINAGTLALGPNGTLGTTAITVASGAHFAARPAALTATAGGTLTFAPGSTFDMNDGAIGTFNISGTSPLTASLVLPGINIGLDLGVSGLDSVNVTNNAAVSGTNTINITPVSTAVQNGTYNLITAAGGLNGNFQFSNGSQTMNINGVTLTLANSATAETVTVSGAVTAFWKGNLSGVWSDGSGTNTNWTSDAAGTIGTVFPIAAANVVFNVIGGTQNPNTTLGRDFTIGSLTFTADASTPITIGGTNTLTINSGGITINNGSAGHTISAQVALGANQTWTNNAGSPFTVSGPISNASNGLTFAGPGTFILTGANTYGTTTINPNANVQVGNGGTTGTLGSGAVINNGTLTLIRSDAAGSATPAITGAVSGTGSLVVNGTGTALITGPVTSTGTTLVNSGTLQTSSFTVPGYDNALTINGGATMVSTGTINLAGSTSKNITSISGSGTLSLMSTNSSPTNPDLFSQVTSNSYYAIEVNVPINLGPGLHYIGGKSGNNSYGQYDTGDVLLENNLSGSGGLAVSGAATNSQFEVALQGDNTNWTGPLVLNSGNIAVVNSVTTALSGANTVTFTPPNGSTGALYLFGTNITIGSLSGTAAGNMFIRNGSVVTATAYQPGDAVLTINQTTPGTFAGIISDGPDDYYAGRGNNNHLGITMAGTAPLTLTNVSTFTGPLTINSSVLNVTASAGLGNTAITVNSGATLAVAPGVVIGDPTVAGAGATLTINGGTFDTTLGGTLSTVGRIALHQNSAFYSTSLTLNSATLNFNLNAAGVTSIVSDGSASVSGTNTVNITSVGTGTYAPATYALITATTGLAGGSFVFGNNSTTETLSGNTLNLVNTDGAEEIAVNGGATVPLNAYYTGSVSGNLLDGGNNTPTNFATDATGSTNTNYLPGATTNVFFTANNANNLNTTLNQNLAINGLTFTASEPGLVTISGNGILTVGAGGITVAPNSQSGNISTGQLVASTALTITNNSTNPLTITSNVSGGNLTFSGAGPVVLTGTNTYGTTNISTGAMVQVGNGGSTGSLGTGAVIDNGTLAINQTGSVTFAGNISGTGIVAQSGPGLLTLTSTQLLVTGGLAVNSGTLQVNGNVSTALTVNVNGNGTFVTNGNFSSSRTHVITDNGIMQASSGTLLLKVNQNGSLTGSDITGSGTLQLRSTTDSLAAPDLFFGPDHSGTAYYGTSISVATLDLGSAQRYIVANSGHNTVAKYYQPTNAGVDALISSNIVGTGGITYQGNQEGTTSGFYAPLVLQGSNTFTGTVDIEQGSIYAGFNNAYALTAGNMLVLNNSNVGYSHFFLLGDAITVSNLTSGGTGNTPAKIGIANGNPLMNFAVPAATLTVNETAATNYGGTLANTITDNYDSGSNVPGSLSLTKAGPATLTLSGVSNYNGSTNVMAGSLVYSNASGAVRQQSVGALSLAAGTSVQLAISSNTSSRQVLVVSGLNNAGVIDIGNNAMDIGGGASLPSITSTVAAGYNLGKWNGSTGIISTAAASDSNHLTAIGVLLNNDGNGNTIYGSATGGTNLGKFDGVTNAALNDVLVKYTYYGDANLDGAIDGSDYSRIDAGYISLGALSGWQNGDFNYDGVINGSDYTLIDNAFNAQGASLGTNPAALIASPTAQIGGAASAVPEPTALGLLAMGGAGLLGRRRRN